VCCDERKKTIKHLIYLLHFSLLHSCNGHDSLICIGANFDIVGGCQQLQTNVRRACSLVFIRASVTPTVLGLTPRISGFHDIVLSVVGNVPVNSEAQITSSISSRGFVGPVFKVAHRGRVCVRAFIRVSERAL
jgi:hypothetical protein